MHSPVHLQKLPTVTTNYQPLHTKEHIFAFAPSCREGADDGVTNGDVVTNVESRWKFTVNVVNCFCLVKKVIYLDKVLKGPN